MSRRLNERFGGILELENVSAALREDFLYSRIRLYERNIQSQYFGVRIFTATSS